MDYGVALAGLVVGLLVGLTGVGSGSIVAPIMVLALGVSPLAAVGSNLAWAAATKLTGATQHVRQGTVDFPLVKMLAVGSLPGSLAGVGLTGLLKAHIPHGAERLIGMAIGGSVALVVLAMFLGPRLGPRIASPGLLDRSRAGALRASLLGLAVGVLAGTTSVGGGTLVAVALSLGTALPSRKIVGTNVLHGALLSIVAAAGHIWAGNVDTSLVLGLLLGSGPGAVLGSRLAACLPDRIVRYAMATTLLVAALRLMR